MGPVTSWAMLDLCRSSLSALITDHAGFHQSLLVRSFSAQSDFERRMAAEITLRSHGHSAGDGGSADQQGLIATPWPCVGMPAQSKLAEPEQADRHRKPGHGPSAEAVLRDRPHLAAASIRAQDTALGHEPSKLSPQGQCAVLRAVHAEAKNRGPSSAFSYHISETDSDTTCEILTRKLRVCATRKSLCHCQAPAESRGVKQDPGGPGFCGHDCAGVSEASPDSSAYGLAIWLYIH